MAITSESKVIDKAKEVFPSSLTDRAYFVGLSKQESGFNSKAYNPKGDAYGLFQFSKDMRRAYGMNLTSSEDKQLDAGADYIKQLHQKHKGNWVRILAEHYMGIPRLNRADSGKTDPEIRSFYKKHLPKVEKYASEYKVGEPTGEFREDSPVPRMVANQGFIPNSLNISERKSTVPMTSHLINLIRKYTPNMNFRYSPISVKVKEMSDEISRI